MLEGNRKREAATDCMKQPERAGQLISVMLTVITTTYLFMHWPLTPASLTWGSTR